MMADEEKADSNSSPALIELAMYVRSSFGDYSGHRREKLRPQSKVIVKASEVAQIYFDNQEKLTADELEILFEILREFEIVVNHTPPDFHTHVANVVLCYERGEAKTTPSHLKALIFTKVKA